MVNPNDILSGLYNLSVPCDYSYNFKKSIKNVTTDDFIDVIDIKNYKYTLFEENKKYIDELEVAEQLSNNSNSENISHSNFISYVREYDILLINQDLLMDFMCNGEFPLNYKIVINNSLIISNKEIKCYILPKELECLYFIKFDNEGDITSYKKILQNKK